jgi:hypothetical protein
MVDSMDQEAQQIRAEALKMAWYMRGGLSYNDALNLSVFERQSVGRLIKENLDTTKKSNLPFF